MASKPNDCRWLDRYMDCCRHCRNTARTSRAHAAKFGGMYYTPRKAVETIYDAASGSGAFIMSNLPFTQEVRNA